MQEEKGRNNTAMLTVIAIATLLVAVVGATFAYFSTTETNNTDVQVTATTKGADTFSASTSGSIELNVTAATMQEEAGSNTYQAYGARDTDSTLTVSLTANSGTATCQYDVVYIPTTAYTAVQSELVEFGISGVAKINNVETANSFTNVSAAGSGQTLTGTSNPVLTGIYLKQNASISDSAEGSGTQNATVESWTFEGDYYNLETVDQSAKAGTSFGGDIKVVNVRCTNSNS